MTEDYCDNLVGNLGGVLIFRIDLKGSTGAVKWLPLGQQGLDFGPSAVISQVRTPRRGRGIPGNPAEEGLPASLEPDCRLALLDGMAIVVSQDRASSQRYDSPYTRAKLRDNPSFEVAKRRFALVGENRCDGFPRAQLYFHIGVDPVPAKLPCQQLHDGSLSRTAIADECDGSRIVHLIDIAATVGRAPDATNGRGFADYYVDPPIGPIARFKTSRMRCGSASCRVNKKN